MNRRGMAVMAAGLALWGDPAQAGDVPGTVLARGGADYQTRESERDLCRQTAWDAPSEDLPRSGEQASAGGYGGDLGVALGAAIAFAIIGMFQENSARGQAALFCMANLGYVAVPLTAEEYAEVDGLRGDRRQAWEEAFLAQDLAERVAAVSAPRVPPLPGYRDEPATIGGVRVLTSGLRAADGAVGLDQPLMTGQIERWRTAVLAEPFEGGRGAVQISAQPGAVFHQVDHRPQTQALMRDPGATWCGPVQETANGVTSEQLYCFTSHRDSYEAFRPSGHAWLAGPYRAGIVLSRIGQPIVLAERESDDLGPIDFDVRATRLTRTEVTVRVAARRGPRSVELAERRLTLNGLGEAVLPIWDRQLRIRRTGPDTLTASLEDGRGRSWRVGG